MIEGQKVNLRPIIKNDLKNINKWKNNEIIFKYLGGGYQPISADIQLNWMESLMDTTGNTKRYIIETKDHSSIGFIGLYSINWIHRNAELGVYIGNIEQQGNGFAKEACVLLENYAHRYLNLCKLKVFVVKKNHIAVNMYKKLDYNIAGELKNERYIDGEFCNLLLMEKFI